MDSGAYMPWLWISFPCQTEAKKGEQKSQSSPRRQKENILWHTLWLNFAIYLLWFSATARGIREDAALKESPPLQNNTPEAAWGLQIAGGKRVPPQPASLCRSQAWPCSKLHGKTCSTMSKWLWILLRFLHKYFLLLTDLLFSVFSSHKSTLLFFFYICLHLISCKLL